MSELGDLESALIGLLQPIEWNGAPAFASVGGLSDANRKDAVAAIAREHQPAALVVYDGRRRSDLSDHLPGGPRMTVLISTRHLGGADRPRLGDDGRPGGFDLLGLVIQVLDGAVVEADRRLQFIDEQLVSADERTVVYEQRYVVERMSELAPPTFDGSAIAGSESLVSVVVGKRASERAVFGFPGIDGEYRHFLGTRSRPIRWQGQLRAADDAALNTIESALEALAADPTPRTLTDAWGREQPDCVLESFERKGPRRRHPVTGQAVQNFELTFVQLRTEN